MPPLNKEFESNVPPQTWKTSLSALLLVTVHINTFFTWLRTFVAKSALLRLRAFREALLTKIWWLGAYKYFIGPVLSYWLTVRLFSTGSTNSLQEASILFQHIILPQVIVLFVECKSFPPHLRTFLSNFVATDVYALSLKSLPGVFFPFLVWAKFWVALLSPPSPIISTEIWVVKQWLSLVSLQDHPSRNRITWFCVLYVE